jgi:hypothetical protein
VETGTQEAPVEAVMAVTGKEMLFKAGMVRRVSLDSL